MYTEVLAAHEFVLIENHKAAENITAVYKQELFNGFSLQAYITEDDIRLLYAHNKFAPDPDGGNDNLGIFDIDVDYEQLDAAVRCAHFAFYSLRAFNKALEESKEK